MSNNSPKAVVTTSAVQIEVPTLESVLTGMTDTQRLALLLDPKKLAELKRSLPKNAGHRVRIMALLSEGPKTVSELAKLCCTTVKTVQSYICYLNSDAKAADILHAAHPEKPAGVRVFSYEGKYMLKADFLKSVA